MIYDFGNFNLISEKNQLIIKEFLKKINKKIYDFNIYVYYGYPIYYLDDSKEVIKCLLICKKGIMIFYENVDEGFNYERYLLTLAFKNVEVSKCFLHNHRKLITSCEINDINNVIKEIENLDDIIEDRIVELFNSIVQNALGLIKKDDREIKNNNSLGNIIKLRSEEISKYDKTQFEMIYNDITSHIRIRGLAGSGKTILLVKKMAYLHFKDPSYDLVYVFYTQSLKQYIRDLFIKFYKDFEPNIQPDFSKIKFLHSWGSSSVEGFYSRICMSYGVPRKTYGEVRNETDPFDYVCKELVDTIKEHKLNHFDYIFIDEAQDFPLYFYKLALKLLKPMGKIIYAYDELQSLSKDRKKVPSKKDIFGNEQCNDINLKYCYRNSKEILVTAHALGLGIYSKKDDGSYGIVSMIEDINLWKDIGYYEIEGKLDYGSQVKLTRDDIVKYKLDDPIEIYSFDKLDDQMDYAISTISKLIEEQDIVPDDFLIIDLDTISFNNNFNVFKKHYNQYIESKEIKGKRPFDIHLVNKDNAFNFKINDSIPYTTIFRAKGNEANIVIILNSNILSSLGFYSRNRLFTAITRSKIKSYILGSRGIEKFIEEVETVKNKQYSLDFVYPTLQELEKIHTTASKEAQNINDLLKAIELGKTLRETNSSVMLDLLLEQTGSNNIDDLLDYIKELKKGNNDEE